MLTIASPKLMLSLRINSLIELIKKQLFAILVIYWCLGLPTVILAQSNSTLDLSFGDNGIVRTDFGRLYEYGTGMLIQEDQKIVVVGRSCEEKYTVCDAVAVRYNTDGSLDATFGEAGIVMLDFGNDENVYHVGLQSDGKIILCGFSEDKNEHNDLLLIRLNTDGSIDSTFANNGVMINENHFFTYEGKMVMQPDDKIVTLGYYFESSSAQFMVNRYTADGFPDSTFGNAGVSYPYQSVNGVNYPHDIVMQEDGKILFCGEHGYYIYKNACILRLLPDGSLDTTFSDDYNGVAEYNLGNGYCYNYALAVQSDGKILTAGIASYDAPLGRQLFVIRTDEFGAYDNTFNQSGLLKFNYDGLGLNLTLIDITSDNKIIVAGIIDYKGQRGVDCILARITEDGQLDKTFGYNGIVTQHLFTLNDNPYALALQADNKIVLSVNGDYNPGNFDFNLIRFNPDATIPNAEDEEVTIFTNGIVNNELIITNTTNEGMLSIYNMLGQLVFQQNACIFQTVINTTNFDSGVYIIHFQTGDQTQVLRCIKN